MNKITSYDLQKIMVRAYQDPNITASFVEMIYDYFNNTNGVKKISYNDNLKYVDIIPKKKCDKLKVLSDLKTLFGQFVINVLNVPNLEFLLSVDPNYYVIKNEMVESDVFNIAVGMINILDLSTPEDIIIRINLIN